MLGKLIALEGGDGSGKGTQFTLLCDYLKQKNIPFETMDFPQYGKTFFGDLVGQMLAGDFGKEVPPHLAVLPFACDRWLMKDHVNRWLSEGKLVISNRYTGSSAVYHAAKTPRERQYSFIEWVYQLEQDVIGMPKEDIALYFHVPAALSQKLIEQKDARGYLGTKKKDIYEEDVSVQERVEALYLELATNHQGWKTIECMEADVLRSKESIHKDVLDVLGANGVL